LPLSSSPNYARSTIIDFKIVPICPEFDLAVGEVIKKTGAEFGAIGDGFGPSDDEVSSMSQYYQTSSQSLYIIPKLLENAGFRASQVS